MNKIICVIPARYKSTRFPGKPIANICGKPMIWWVYQQCLKVAEIDAVYIATDNAQIADVCKNLNMQYCMTGEQPTGTDRVAEVAEQIDGDLFINIQGDEPLIEPAMIKELIDIFNDNSVMFGTLKSEIIDENEIEAASTVKVVTDKNNDALFFSRSIIPSNIKGDFRARTYRHVGVYGYRKDALKLFHSWEQTELELGEGIEPLRLMDHGYKIKVAETKYKSVGVDYPEHIKLVENIINKSRELK